MHDLDSNLNLGIEHILSKDKKNFVYTLKNILFSQKIIANNITISWSSLQAPFEKINEKYDNVMLEYFKKENADIYITNSIYQNEFMRIVTFYFNELSGNFKFSEEMIFIFKIELLKILSNLYIKDVIFSNKYFCFICQKSVTRKILEPMIRVLFEKE